VAEVAAKVKDAMARLDRASPSRNDGETGAASFPEEVRELNRAFEEAAEARNRREVAS
jgi:hypothetical protein